MNSITINGVRIEVQGSASNISIRSVVKTGLSGEVRVVWDGPLASLDCDGSAVIHGTVAGSINAGSGVTVTGDVHGNVKTGYSVLCQKVGGSIQAGGSVKVG